MSNWYYNEVEMMNKHKMLNRAGSRTRVFRFVQEEEPPGLFHRAVVFSGQCLVDAGRRLLDRYETIPTIDVVPQAGGPDGSR